MAGSLSNLPKRQPPLSLRTTPSPNPSPIQALNYMWKSSVPAAWYRISKQPLVQLTGRTHATRNTQEFLSEKQQYIRTIRKRTDPASIRFSVSTLQPVLRRRGFEVGMRRNDNSPARKSWNTLSTRAPMVKAAIARKPRKIDLEMQGKVEIAAIQNEFGDPVITIGRRKSGLLTGGNFTTRKPSKSEGAEQSPGTVARQTEIQRKGKMYGSNEGRQQLEDMQIYATDRALPGWKLGSNHRRKAKFPEGIPLDSSPVLQIHRFLSLPYRE